MNKKDQQRENIMNHGLKLKRIFNMIEIDPGPMTLCKSVHRIEMKAHKIGEALCNGYIEQEQVEAMEERIIKSLDKVLGFKELGIPVFINLDPRGYALKIDSDYVRDNSLDIYRDWGGYGIIAPEF